MTPGSPSAIADSAVADDLTDESTSTSEALTPELFEAVRADLAARREQERAAAAEQQERRRNETRWVGRFEWMADTPVSGV